MSNSQFSGPNSPLARAISNNSRPQFVVALHDIDPSVVGWADAAIKSALYQDMNAVFFLREMTKKGVLIGPAHDANLFKIAMLNDGTGGLSKLLARMGYRPAADALAVGAHRLKNGEFSVADKMIALLPKNSRSKILANACADALFGSIPDDQVDKLNKLWAGKPHTANITDRLFELTASHDQNLPEVAAKAVSRGWVVAAEIADKMSHTALTSSQDHLARLISAEFLNASTPVSSISKGSVRRM